MQHTANYSRVFNVIYVKAVP